MTEGTRVAGDLVRRQFFHTYYVLSGPIRRGNTPSRPSMCIPTRRPHVCSVHANSARQAVPGEHCSALARCLLPRDDGFPVRIILTYRKCVAYKAAPTVSPEPIGFSEGAPMPLRSQPNNRLRSRQVPGLHSLLDTYPRVLHGVVCWAGPSRPGVRYRASAAAPSRRPVPIHPPSHHLKGLQPCGPCDRRCV